ncbi:capsular polysaccharide export protein [Loktanella sp. PT4BL]|jgi:capsular polysaccharide export protein|uniref:capsular polysaccharide export protein, LipB/KpsS family n=1 Tax=Loktanella sp. PT4BL TaxID=2135611 RepID=UPI000D75E6AD|nr:capsular biosynthesis protein [Loktanella sp. PT4BL]PXW69009.1 capsular polysaccharide export protein [Loktanella sp. PT4BL]
MDEAFTFVCLDPRKQKRADIARLLGPVGAMQWMRLPKMRLRNWPQTKVRAETALMAARHIPAEGLKRRLWSWILQKQYNGMRQYFEAYPTHVAVAWNGLNGSRRVFIDAAKDAGAKTLSFELGPFPGRITVDPKGVNFANALPRDPAPYLDWLHQSHINPNDWRALGAKIKQRVPIAPPAQTGALPPLTDPFIFAPLQVPGDSQLRLFGGNYRTVESFVKALHEAAGHLPEGWHLRIKEHPSTPAFVGDLLRDVDAPIYLDNTTDTFAQVTASRGVITINSSVGLEAVFFDKPVVACGQCFWAIPGMAEKAPDQDTMNQTIARADTWQFDLEIRNAVMSFLAQVYYPERQPNETKGAIATIIDRLNGTGPFAFIFDTSEAKR